MYAGTQRDGCLQADESLVGEGEGVALEQQDGLVEVFEDVGIDLTHRGTLDACGVLLLHVVLSHDGETGCIFVAHIGVLIDLCEVEVVERA